MPNYINYRYLYSKGFTESDYHALLKVFQRDFHLLSETDDKESLDKFLEAGVITYLKNKKEGIVNLRITPEGKLFLDRLSTYEFDESILALTQRLVDLYEQYGRSERSGSFTNVNANLTWFVHETSFNHEYIYKTVERYLSETEPQYTKKLDNLIWEAPNLYATHKNTKDSYLYDLIFKSERLQNIKSLEDTKDKSVLWMLDLCKLKTPKGLDECFYFTGSYKGDVDFLSKMRSELVKKIKK